MNWNDPQKANEYFIRLFNSVNPDSWDSKPRTQVFLQMKANEEARKAFYARCAEYAWEKVKLIGYLEEVGMAGPPLDGEARRIYSQIVSGELNF